MTSDITYSSLVERCSRARYCMSKKTRSITRSSTLIHVFNTRQAEHSNSLLKLCHRLFPSLPLLCPPVVSQVDNRRAPITVSEIYKCPSLSGSRNPQQFPSCLAILSAALLPPASFLSFVPVQNLIPSSLKGLISPLLLVLFPRHPLKRAGTVPDGSDGRSRGGWYLGIDGTNISAESVSVRVCVSVDGNHRAE